MADSLSTLLQGPGDLRELRGFATDHNPWAALAEPQAYRHEARPLGQHYLQPIPQDPLTPAYQGAAEGIAGTAQAPTAVTTALIRMAHEVRQAHPEISPDDAITVAMAMVPGAKGAARKLTVAKFLEQYPKGGNLKALADNLGVSDSTLRNILNEQPEQWRLDALKQRDAAAAEQPAEASGGRKAITSLRTGASNRQAAIDQAETEAHIIPKTEGGYVGAPKSIRGPEDIQALRDKIDQTIQEGAEGADWYKRARAAISDMTGGEKNPEAANRASFQLAATSPQSDPNTNLGAMLQGNNRKAANLDAGIVRTGYVGDLFDRYARGENPSLGAKTGIYERGINPVAEEPWLPVNDTHHARGFGYTNPDGTTWNGSVNPQMHAFMDNETILGADRAGMSPTEAQAAMWVRTKALNLMKLRPKLSYEEAFAEANKTYADYMRKHTAYDTNEPGAPYAGSGHLEGFKDLPEGVRIGYANAPGSTWAPGGRDTIYDTLGMYSLPSQRATGIYEGPKGMEHNAVDVARPLVDFEQTPNGPKIPQHTQDMINAATAIKGLAGVQGGSPWSKPIYATKPGKASAIMGEGAGPMDLAKLLQANEAAGKHGMIAIDTGEGPLVFDPMGNASPEVITTAHKAGVGGEGARRVGREGGYFSLEDELKPENFGKGLATRKALDEIAKLDPVVQERLSQSPAIADVARAMNERDAEFAAEHGLKQRPDIQNLREVMSQPGWRQRLADMLQAGNVPLPGIALAPLGAGAAYGVLGGERQ